MRRAIILTALFLPLIFSGCSSDTAPPPTPPNASPDEPQKPNANHKPQLTLSVDTTSEKRGIKVIATATDADDVTLSYSWSFGDGQTAQGGSSYTYSYQTSGSYTVTVSVSDSHETVKKSRTVTVQHLRPSNTPDVIIFSFSGRCGTWISKDGFGCIAPGDNDDYLSKSPNNTTQAVAKAFGNIGYSSQWYSFRSNLRDSNKGWGYIKAQELLDDAKRDWIGDYDNPSKLVVVGHSHGTQFASLLAYDNPDVYWDYFIYLDGVCTHWETDHLGANLAIRNRFKEEYGSQSNYPFPLNETNAACDAFSIPQYGIFDMKDVVGDNVIYALEVKSNGFLYDGDKIRDEKTNRNTDGSTKEANGIATIFELAWGHSEIAHFDHGAMQWVANMIELNGFTNIRTQDTPLKKVEAPQNFLYYMGE